MFGEDGVNEGKRAAGFQSKVQDMQPIESEVSKMLKGSERNAEWTFVDIQSCV